MCSNIRITWCSHSIVGGVASAASSSHGVGVVRRRVLVVVRDPVLDVVVVETRVEDGCGSTRGGFVSSSATVRVRERVAHLVHPPRDGIAEASFSRSDDALAAGGVRVGVESETPAATRVAIVVARESRFGLPARVALRRGLVASHDARFREADHAVGGHRRRAPPTRRRPSPSDARGRPRRRGDPDPPRGPRPSRRPARLPARGTYP